MTDRTIIEECIKLLQESGKNTKAIVLEKLRGLVGDVRDK